MGCAQRFKEESEDAGPWVILNPIHIFRRGTQHSPMYFSVYSYCYSCVLHSFG